MAVKTVPDGYHTVTPYMTIRDAAKALEFYKKAFGAEVAVRMDGPGGRISHAEMRIGNSMIMLSDEAPEMGAKSPQQLGGSPVKLLLYVDDVDAITKRAVEAGATIVRPVEDQFYGDRVATIEDPFAHQWFIHTHKEDVSGEEMQRRLAAMAGAPAS